jgi:hypothetical protein
MRGITVLRTDPDDMRREIRLSEMDVRHRGDRHDGVQLLRPDDPTERSDMLPIIPETEQATALVSASEYVLLHFRWDRESGGIAADDEEVDLPAMADPAMAQVRDDALRAAPKVHAVYVDPDLHERASSALALAMTLM